MSRKHHRAISLSLSHARLKLASDLIRWSITGETDDILDRHVVLALAEQVKGLSDVAWQALVEDSVLKKG